MFRPYLVKQRSLGIYTISHIFLLIIFWSNATIQITIEIVPFFLLTWISIFKLAQLSHLGLHGLYQSIFFLFIYVFLGLAPLLQIATDTRPLPFPVTNQDFMKAGYLILLSLPFYFLGCKINARHLTNFFSRQINQRRIPIFTWLSIMVSIPLMLSFGIGNLFRSREELNAILFSAIRVDNSVGAIKSALLSVPIFIALICEIQSSKKKVASDNLRILLLVLLNAVINNPISQSRFWFSTVWGTFFLLLSFRRKSIQTKLPLFLIIGILIVFPNSDIFRYKGSSFDFNIVNPVVQLTQKGDFDSLQQISWGIKTVSEQGYLRGKQIAGAALFFIPRSVWNEKPLDTGIYLAKYAGYANTSLSAPIWIEAFIDFGALGTFLYLFILGLLHAALRRATITNFNSVWLLFALYQLVILRGSLIQSMATTFSIVVCIVFLTKSVVN